MRQIFLLFTALLFSQALIAKSGIYGSVTDEETGESLIYASLVLTKNGKFQAGGSTDFAGNYSIPVDPGTYDLKVSYTGYPDRMIEGVIVKASAFTILEVKMMTGIMIETVVVTAYKVPLIEQDHTTQGGVVTSEQIRSLPRKNVTGLKATTAGLSQAEEGSNITVRGSRAGSTNYYIDGIRVRGNLSKEEAFMRQQPFHGGTPAMYENQLDQQQSKATKTDPIVLKEDPIQTRENYDDIVENDFQKTTEEKISTFSIDVDQAGYSNVRRFINNGMSPPRAAIRIEEMINYFDYEYAQPTDGHPFSINTELGGCPWNSQHKLLHIGLQGENLSFEKAASNNLVFLIDVSGSMSDKNKLPLLKKSFALLVDQLRPEDRIAIVVYAGAAGLVLPSTPVAQKETILKSLEQLNAGGSTAGGAGIHLAYQTALDFYMEDGNNRVILATDGDFNVGTSSVGGLEKLIEEKRKSGIYLSVLGFGMYNLQDHQLETLADKGNGHYAYIDDFDEAKKIFQTELTSTLYTIAKDVKLQLVFNPLHVKSYRLVGYENRLLATEDFDDDTKDAGELGAGHTVTAIYELVLNTEDQDADLMEVKFRYKRPDEEQSRFIKQEVLNRSTSVAATSDNFRFSAAVAAFGMILKGSKYAGDADCRMVTELAEDAISTDPNGYRQAFLELVNRYDTIHLTSNK